MSNDIYSFPKIYSYGYKEVSGILTGEIEVTEKIDGSQFNFGLVDGEIYFRSKGKNYIFTSKDIQQQLQLQGLTYRLNHISGILFRLHHSPYSKVKRVRRGLYKMS